MHLHQSSQASGYGLWHSGSRIQRPSEDLVSELQNNRLIGPSSFRRLLQFLPDPVPWVKDVRLLKRPSKNGWGSPEIQIPDSTPRFSDWSQNVIFAFLGATHCPVFAGPLLLRAQWGQKHRSSKHQTYQTQGRVQPPFKGSLLSRWLRICSLHAGVPEVEDM